MFECLEFAKGALLNGTTTMSFATLRRAYESLLVGSKVECGKLELCKGTISRAPNGE